ncbi:MAG: translocation/assembly module TamB domain-containing protein [Syntrophobacteraceae bacterium]
MKRIRKGSKEVRNLSRFPILIFAWTAIIVLIVPLFLILILHLPGVQSEVIKRVIRQIEIVTPLQVQLKNYRWSPFSGLSLKELKVQSSRKNILECEKAQLSYSLSLSRPYIKANEIYLEKPVLRLDKDAEGHWILPQDAKNGNDKAGSVAGGDAAHPAADEASSLMFRFPWPRIRIFSGVVTAEQNGRQILTIRDVTGTLTVEPAHDANGRPSLKVHLGQWQGEADTPYPGKWQLTGEASVQSDRCLIELLTLKLNDKTSLTCCGSLFLRSPHDADLHFELTRLTLSSLPELHSKLPEIKDLSGMIHLVNSAGVLSIDHELGADSGEINGTLRAERNADGRRLIHYSCVVNRLGIPAIKGLPLADSMLTGQVQLTVIGERLQDIEAQMILSLEESRYGELKMQRAKISGSYDRGTITLNGDSIETSLGEFSLSSTADVKGIWEPERRGEVKAEFQAQRAKIEKVLSGIGPQQPAGGAIHFEAWCEPGQILKFQHWNAKAEADMNIPELASLKASGTYKDGEFSTDYKFLANDVQKLSGIYPAWKGRGAVASNGNVKGRWPDFIWEGEITSPHFQFDQLQGEQVSMTGSGKITGKNARREAKLKAGNVTFQGNKIGSIHIELSQLENECRFGLKADQLRGGMSATLSGGVGDIWSQALTVTLNPSRIALNDQAAVIDGKAEVHSDRIIFNSLNLNQNKQKLRIAGELSYEGNSDLKCDLDSINTGYWTNMLGWKDTLTGAASGQIHFSGRADQPQMKIDLSLENGTLNPKETISRLQAAISERTKDNLSDLSSSDATETIEKLRIQGTYSKDLLSLQADVQTPNLQFPLPLSLRLPMHLSLKPFTIDVKGTQEWSCNFKLAGFETEHLQTYLGFLDKLGGRLEAEGQVGGTLERPAAKGFGSWRSGYFQIRKWPHPIEDIELEWQANAGQIKIQKATMKLLNGHANIEGSIDYPKFDAIEIQGEGENLDIPEFLGIEGTVSGRAKLSQTKQGLLLTGKFKSTKAAMNLKELETDLARRIDIIDGDSKGEVLVVQGEVKRKSKFFEQLKMELAIELSPSGSWVRGNGLEAEITGSLRIEKAASGDLRLFGNLQTLRGTYTFQGNKLKIVEGQLAFLGAPKPDPQLRILCEKEVSDAIIQVHVTGPLSQTRLALSSMPSMNRVDILSYLIFGHPAGELSSNESSQLQTRAAAWLGSETSQLLKGLLGETPFAPDTLQFRGATGKIDRSNRATTSYKEEGGVIEVGKYLTPDLYVTYEHGVMGEDQKQVQVEYRMNRHLSIQTQIGGADESGVDVFWRHDFGK